MDARIAYDPKMVRCECSTVLSIEPSKPDYKQKDDMGNPISKEAAEHMASFRVRCSNCAKNFCTVCNRTPYHVGRTC
jgi:hypothetical protein